MYMNLSIDLHQCDRRFQKVSTPVPRDSRLQTLLLAREQSAQALLARKFYRVPQIAKALGVTTATVRRWVHTGKIPAVRTGGGYMRIAQETLLELQGFPKGGV